MFETKIVRHKISYKKVSGGTSLPLIGGELGGSKVLLYFKFFNILKRQKGLCLWQNAASSIDLSKKCLKQKLFGIKFPTKKSAVAPLYLPYGGN